MKLSGAQLVIRALRDSGIRFLFGIPGTHNIELYDALVDAEDLKTILITDEQSAGFMADGVARASGQLACLNLVPSAGLTHAMSGIAEAFLDQIPLLILSCGIRKDTGASFQLHDVDQAAMARPVVKKVFQPQKHDEIYPMIREAVSLARHSPPGPVMVEVPVNLYLMGSPSSSPPRLPAGFVAGAESGGGDPSLALARSVMDPRPKPLPVAGVTSIVSLLNTSSTIGIYAGLGALHAREILIKLAEKLDAVVFTTISAKGMFPENHPRWVWNTMGRALPKQLQPFEEKLDCLLAVGCRFGEVATASYGLKPPKNLVHIDIDPKVFNKNYKASAILEADAAVALHELLHSKELKEKKRDEEKLTALKEAHEAVRKEQEAHYRIHPDLVSPFQFLTKTQQVFGSDAIYVTDSGTSTFIAMEILRLTKPRSFLGPIDYSCMGYSVPAAIGAKMACPERPVAGLIGDGAYLMTGMELITARAYGAGVVACVLRDGELSQIAEFQRATFNREALTALPSFELKSLAAGMGIDYLAIKSNDEIRPVLSEAKALSEKNRPVVVEVAIDYSRATYFSQGIVKTNFLRFPWKDRLRLISRILKRKFLG